MGRLLLPFDKTGQRNAIFPVGRYLGGQWGSVNTSGIRYGFIFRSPSVADTLTHIWQNHLSVTGTPLTNIAEWEVWDVDTATLTPTGTRIGSQIHTPSNAHVATTFDTPVSLSASTLYACTLRNRASELSLDPASVYFSVKTGMNEIEASYRNEVMAIRSADEGLTWDNASDKWTRDVMFRPQFGTLGDSGFPIASNATLSSYKIYNDTTNIRWVGNRMLQPWDGIPVHGYALRGSTGSPTFAVRMDIWDDDGNLLVSSVPTTAGYRFPFDTDQLLKRGQYYYWVLRAVDNPIGSASVYWSLTGSGSASPTTLQSLLTGVSSASGTTPSFSLITPTNVVGFCEAIENRPRVWRLGAS